MELLEVSAVPVDLPRSENVSYVSLHIEDCNSHFMMLSTIRILVR